jgi:hypothetical protein
MIVRLLHRKFLEIQGRKQFGIPPESALPLYLNTRFAASPRLVFASLPGWIWCLRGGVGYSKKLK